MKAAPGSELESRESRPAWPLVGQESCGGPASGRVVAPAGQPSAVWVLRWADAVTQCLGSSDGPKIVMLAIRTRQREAVRCSFCVVRRSVAA